MNIAIVGTGYVGLVTAACLAEKGHDVTCVDIDRDKVAMLQDGKSPIFEAGLDELLKKNVFRLRYTTDYQSAYKGARAIFIGVGTPEKKDGSANLAYVFEAARQIADSVEHDCVVIVKSTVPIGTNEKVEKILRDNVRDALNVKVVVSNSSNFICASTDYAPDSTVCSKWAA